MQQQFSALIADPKAAEMLARRDLSWPVGMLNLLKLREQALNEAGSGEPPCTGEEAYARYSATPGSIVFPSTNAILRGILQAGIARFQERALENCSPVSNSPPVCCSTL